MYLEVDGHPIPKAYQQVRLDKGSKKLCTFSTHKGIFVYDRIPFGISSAPGIFQRIMDQLLRNIPGVISFQDDILISGVDSKDHFNNLKEVCSKLNDYGLTASVSKDKCRFFVIK